MGENNDSMHKLHESSYKNEIEVKEFQTKEEKKEKETSGCILFSVILYLSAFLVVAGDGLLMKSDFSGMMRDVVLGIFLVSFVLVLFFFNDMELYRQITSKPLFCAGFFLSLISIVLSSQIELFNAWMIGVVLIAMVINEKIAVWTHLILTFIFCIINGCTIELFVYYFILGGVICLVSGKMKTLKEFLEVCVIALATNVVLLFIFSKFSFKEVADAGLFYSVSSTIYIIILSFCFVKIFLKPGEEEPAEQETEQDADAADMDEIVDPDYPLMKELQQYSRTLYMHSVDISELSYRAAKAIGANEKVAKAAGLYHEIGRIGGDNYIEEGMRLAKEHQFPEKVVDAIKQHNFKFEKPSTAEAAIVMLSDSIISTIEYLESVGKAGTISSEKLVSNVFENRMMKGTLDNSGLTVKDFKELKQFYIENAF